MTPGCRICLGAPVPANGYHPSCLQALFGHKRLPRVPIGPDEVMRLASERAGNSSISGVQPKLLMGFGADGSDLRNVKRGGRYILKPPHSAFAHLPENEHLTMSLARLVGLRVPEFGLVPMEGGALAYLVKRFDREGKDGGRKLRQEDFCQALGLGPERKANVPVERCAAIIRRVSVAPDQDVQRFFLQVLFAWWVGNGDMHLKNLSFVDERRGGYRLTPAYDLLCTTVYRIRSLALPVNGRMRDVRRLDFMAFARSAGLDPVIAERTLDELLACEDGALEMIERSPLPPSLRTPFARSLAKRTRSLL